MDFAGAPAGGGVDLYEAMERRRSIRRFTRQKVPQEVLERVLNAARIAPSAVNLQPWRFVVVRDRETLKALVGCTRGGKHEHLAMGDLAVVACGNESECYQRQAGCMKSYAIDVAIAVEHLVLAATAEGLGTCWIGAFDETQVKTLLGIPDPWRVVAMTPLGYPAEDPPPRGRKSLLEILAFERWGGE